MRSVMDFTNQSFLSTLSVIVGVTAFLLGLFVYLDNRRNIINRTFFVLTLATVFWIAFVIAATSLESVPLALFSRKLAFGSASFIAFLIYYFSYLFPRPNKNYQFPFEAALLFAVVIAALGVFTPYILKDIRFIGDVQVNIYGLGYYVFTAYFFLSLIGGMYNFVSKKGDLVGVEVIQMSLVLAGLVISGTLAAFTNLILPRLLGTYSTGQLGPLSVSVFIILSTYALSKHHLFNIRVIAVELLTSAMWLFILFRFLLSPSLESRVMDGGLLIVAVLFGTLLIRSVIKEVNQREKVEKLALDLESANKKLEGLDAARREFLSFASHQLKTPMTVIKGYATLASDPNYLNSPERIKQIVTKIGESTDQMYRLISNFLDARAIEEGKISYIFKPTDIVKLTSGIVEDLIPYAAQRGLTLTFTSSQPSLSVNADETKFRQVIQNLIDNAVKYTEKGWVKVEVTEDRLFIDVSVSDSGKGIAPAARDHLFEQFFRERGTSLKTQGTGLGLYIAREIVKAHQGEIWVDSGGEGKGSKFTVKLKKD